MIIILVLKFQYHDLHHDLLRDLHAVEFQFQDSPPPEENGNDEEGPADGDSVKNMDGPMPAEVVNETCCTGSKACLIL